MQEIEVPGFYYNKRVLVTGAHGFLGRHLCSYLTRQGASVYSPYREALDLLDYTSSLEFFSNHNFKPLPSFDVVFHLAGLVGGIGTVSRFPYDFLSKNLRMALNLVDAMIATNQLTKIVLAGSVCAYPLNVDMPMKEEDLWSGKPEPTNGPYGVAKRVLHTISEALSQNYSVPAPYALMANMYGPGDTFDITSSHVIPALIIKIYGAKVMNEKSVTLWGTGRPTRDFLYVADAAKALAMMGERIEKSTAINIGSGVETSILEVAQIIRHVAKWDGTFEFDTSRPDGQPRRILDLNRSRIAMGWKPETPLMQGIQETYAHYEQLVRIGNGVK